MPTHPILDALHHLPTTLPMRTELRRAHTLVTRQHPHAVPTQAHVSNGVIDAIGFHTPDGLYWHGLTRSWGQEAEPLSTAAERAPLAQPCVDRWTRDELHTALIERPDPDDALHILCRAALQQRPTFLLHMHTTRPTT